MSASSILCEWLNTMLTNNVGKLDLGTGQYTFLLSDRGGIIDDLIVYRIGQQKFLLVVNAARTDEDFGWLDEHKVEHASGLLEVEGASETLRILAESPFKARASQSYFALCLARMPIFRREIRLPIFHSRGRLSPSRAPVTPARMGSRFSFEQQTQGKFGTPRSKKAKRSESSRAVWARATRCALKCVTPSTAQIFRRNEIRSRQDWDSLSI